MGGPGAAFPFLTLALACVTSPTQQWELRVEEGKDVDVGCSGRRACVYAGRVGGCCYAEVICLSDGAILSITKCSSGSPARQARSKWQEGHHQQLLRHFHAFTPKQCYGKRQTLPESPLLRLSAYKMNCPRLEEKFA